VSEGVIAVVQARMGSTRLPGKVLADLDGVPMLRFMLDRLDRAPVDALVVATSTDERDDGVAEVAAAAGVDVVRGSEADVLGRFEAAMDRHPSRTIVRLTADCPFADPDVVATAIATHRSSAADYTSNTLVRTFPDGLDVEVVEATALRAAIAEARSPDEREHVTPFVYRRPERFALAAFVSESYLGDERWTVDTLDDLEFLRNLVQGLGRRDFSWRDVVPLAAARRPQADRHRLLPAADSTPATRRWVLLDGADAVGRVELQVTSGRGEAALAVPDGLEADAERLLRDRLRADAQVTELSVRS
jgi:spore coat polysaccharide biosynthesis protein SpsF